MPEWSQYDLFIGQMQRLDNLLQQAGDHFYKEVTARQWYLLCHIGECSPPPTLSQLAQKMGSSHQNVKQMARSLERKGYLRLCTDEGDHRKRRVVLTERYQELWNQCAWWQEAFLRQIFADVDQEELAAAANLLHRVETNILRQGQEEE